MEHIKFRTVLPRVLLSTSIGLYGIIADAAQNEYQVSSTLRYGTLDNPTMASGSNGTEDNLTQYQANIGLARTTSKLLTTLGYNFSKLDYEKGLLDDRNLATGSGVITWSPIQDTFSWHLSNNRSQQVIDPLEPTTQNNLVTSNITSTGPSLQFRLGGRTSALTNYTYAKAATQSIAESKQERNSYSIALQHRLTAKFTTGLSYTDVRVNLDSLVTNEFEQSVIAINNNYASERYQASFSAGYTDSSASLGSNYFDLSFKYTPIENTTLDLSYTDKVNDQFSNLLQNPGAFSGFGLGFGGNTFSRPTSSAPQIPSTEEPLVGLGDTTLRANFLQQFAVKSSRFRISHQSRDIFDTALEYSVYKRDLGRIQGRQNESRLGLLLRLKLNHRITLAMNGKYAELDFDLNNLNQRRRTLAATADWVLNSKMNLQLSVSKSNQRSDLSTHTRESTNAYLAFTYKILSNR
jgi:hypothetical protein